MMRKLLDFLHALRNAPQARPPSQPFPPTAYHNSSTALWPALPAAPMLAAVLLRLAMVSKGCRDVVTSSYNGSERMRILVANPK